MKEWWNNLSLREKQSLLIGGACVVLFLIYLICWLPLSNKIISMREQIVKEQKLLAWMRETNQRIQQIEKTLHTQPSNPSSESLLTLIQKQINKTQFVNGLTQLRQADVDSVQLSFSSVDFDKLIAWLTELWQQDGIVISQMSVTATGTTGMVTADFILKK